jgi:hypothetical protein
MNNSPKYVEFAQCLSDKGAVFYGAFWCTHCKSQKQMFGAPAVKKLNEGKPSYVLHRNKQGNYEHPETHFVFDKTTKEVYGRQTDSDVEPLTAEEIEMCRKLNFKCRLPSTLTKNDDDITDNIEEEDDIEDDEEDEEEEEDEDDDDEN